MAGGVTVDYAIKLQWGLGLIETRNRDPCPKSEDFVG